MGKKKHHSTFCQPTAPVSEEKQQPILLDIRRTRPDFTSA